jgi:CubicO group peptidase (beta-lactamase class C family)
MITPSASRIVVLIALSCFMPMPSGECLAQEFATAETATAETQTAAEAFERLKQERRAFQGQELTTAKAFSYVFNAGAPPRIIWRDVDEVRRLGSDGALRVRWFDDELNEVDIPSKPGRWGALVEGMAPSATPVRRALMFYCRPEGFLFVFPPESATHLSHVPGPIAPEVWSEHQAEFDRVSKDLFFRAVNDSEAFAILLGGLGGTKPLGRPARPVESAAVRHDEYQLALKLKVLGLEGKVKPLRAPRKRAGGPAPVIREGTPAEAGMKPGAKAAIDAVCRAWAEDSGTPFVTLVARHGVMVTHEAFGKDAAGEPIRLDYRQDVFSITKTVTAILYSRFLDQGLLDLDVKVSVVLPDYPKDSPHVPTFRQCLTHTSGLTGHGDWGGVRNPHFDNIVLNGIDVNEPGKVYAYSGMGFDLTAEAMEIVSGKSVVRLYHEELFAPLGMGDVPMDNASSGVRPTARQLAILGQWLCNRGSYGELEFISREAFERLLPERLGERYPGVTEVEGIGNHWMRDPRPGAPRDSDRTEDLFFSPRTIGHGSLSSCILRVDLEQGLVIAQIRKEAGPRFGEWQAKFFAAIAEHVVVGR